jgi:L-threonylcarbamoyladenylate synthase
VSQAELLATETPQAFEYAVKRAAELLRAGEVVALPTETVYGLAANAFDQEAVARIFEIKGRPPHNPVIVHISSISMAQLCAVRWSEIADKLARAFWPGPLTLVLQRSEKIPDIVTAGGDTVGLRWPSHPFIQAVIRECGFPLAAPSANPANRISPTNAEHVHRYFVEQIPLIVDGGQCQIGIESTVLDVSESPPRLLRPGMIHQAGLLAVTEQLLSGDAHASKILRSPGLLNRHYSPRAKLIICSWTDDRDLRRQLNAILNSKKSQLKIYVIAHTKIPSPEPFERVSVIPHDAEAFARAIYGELHQCDEAGAELIVVEDIPLTDEWQAIRDRLKRAAG